MSDIYQNKISYLHDGTDVTNDEFNIILQDLSANGYILGNSEEVTSHSTVFHVQVDLVDDGTPIIKANKGIAYLEHHEGKVS